MLNAKKGERKLWIGNKNAKLSIESKKSKLNENVNYCCSNDIFTLDRNRNVLPLSRRRHPARHIHTSSEFGGLCFFYIHLVITYIFQWKIFIYLGWHIIRFGDLIFSFAQNSTKFWCVDTFIFFKFCQRHFLFIKKSWELQQNDIKKLTHNTEHTALLNYSA